MPVIRFPAPAVPLLPLCKGHGEGFVFRTYADLIGFLAAYGFTLSADEGEALPAKIEFTNNPNPIELDIFSNRGLYSNFLMIAMRYESWRGYSEDDDMLCKLIEKHVAVGAIHLTRQMGELVDPLILANLLIATKSESEGLFI
jgi:hypothetical protein